MLEIHLRASDRHELEAHEDDAGHGFDCDHRGSFNSAASAHARQRSLEFLTTQLGPAA
ncbi:hypothetical protein ENSA5_52940 [Enhygromyxa salina]|uniref:Uncharacterized protein n=1 Tax=Enhygromyxa salina TaxID=215803 RepID=A0A2S9XFS0_9BACT|nr:dienelactone hydrolase family protein [Enhygromyxa salina]PRP91714.1 hypothetical protein ENSA5_52940 [Enhygromyxa salina]